jgi:hypothetical protein
MKGDSLAQMQARSEAARLQIEQLIKAGWKVSSRSSSTNPDLIIMSVTLQKSGELSTLRCRYCNRILCRVESFTAIEILCSRCKSMNTFP